MNVTLNKNIISVEESTSITTLLSQQNIEPKGVAVAVNMKIIKRDAWSETLLTDGDSITVIQATYGG